MLPSFSMETWTLIVLLLTLLIIYGTWPYGHFKNMGIPGPRPWPFVGSFGSMIMKGFHVFDQQCFQKYGRMWGIFEGRLPVLMVTDTEAIKAVMVKEFYTAFTNRRRDVLAGSLSDAITSVEDEKWKRIRTSLSPTFTSGRIKEVFPIVAEYANRLIEYLKKQNLNEPIIIKDMFGLYNIDVLTSTSFSVEADSINNPNDPFVANVKKLMDFSLFNPVFLISIVCPSLVPLMDKIGISFLSPSLMDYFYGTLRKIKEQHGEDANRRVDFLRVMMRSQISNEEAEKSSEDQPIKGLTEHEILSQSFLFILAGYDTTGNTLSFLAYSIATNPDAQSKLIEEIDSVFPNNAPVTYEKLTHLEYLDMVICESQRMWPATPRIERMCKQTVVINGVTIPEGTLVSVPVPVLHNDPELWPSPEVFKPERFSKDNKESIDPYAYLPFGVGPRNCIGMRFALMMVKVIMVQLLQNFKLETCKETLIPMELDGIFRPKKPIMLKLVPRSHLRTEE
ncbi:cytochrome P450 3A27-like [Sardina pilchardus]|uniref:cytochrome P450 3A27-like n=1 Tax=Sardina pilchardus TaxID=27697 RepID=UPI002E15C948